MASKLVLAELCIYIASWNVGTNPPGDTSLTSMLSINKTNCGLNRMPDIYVIGLQEANIDSKSSVLDYFQDNEWISKLSRDLELEGYYKLKSESLIGIVVILFVQSQHLSHIAEVESQETRTGFGGLWGNKGAVSIRMRLYDTAIIFVCSHLAAHDKKLKQRISDYYKIINSHQHRSILDHDAVFWFGDLNFRLEGDDPAAYISEIIESGNYSHLLAYDELIISRNSGHAFGVFNEQTPTFAPTYKFIEKTSKYDMKRRPAWCDRILHRVVENTNLYELGLVQNSYKAHFEYNLSDHKPVTAEFIYTIQTISNNNEDFNDLPALLQSNAYKKQQCPFLLTFIFMMILLTNLK